MRAPKTVNRNKTIWLLQVCHSLVSKPSAATTGHQKPAEKLFCTGQNRFVKIRNKQILVDRHDVVTIIVYQFHGWYYHGQTYLKYKSSELMQKYNITLKTTVIVGSIRSDYKPTLIWECDVTTA